ncbi:MAG: hypothetical protein KDC35_18210 [Acidobacteria bacterium]|nr:hypothetical protein [Acidobacteriota bacterium]
MSFNWKEKMRQLGFNRAPKSADEYIVAVIQQKRWGQPLRAMELLREAHQHFPERFDFLEQYWDQAVRCGKADQALSAFKELFQRLNEKDDWVRAYFHWCEATHALNTEVLSLQTSLKFGTDLLKANMADQAHKVMSYALNHAPPSLPSEQVFGIVAALGPFEPNLIVRAIDLFLKGTRKGSEREALIAMKQAIIQKSPQLTESVHYEPSIEVLPPLPTDLVDDPFVVTRIKQLHVTQANLLAADHNAITLTDGNRSRRIEWNHIRALSCAQIKEFGSDYTYIIDLLDRDPFVEAPFHRVLRLMGRAEQFKCAINEEFGNDIECILSLAIHIADRSGGRLIPEDYGTGVLPELPEFGSVVAFECEVYGVDACEQSH